MTFGSAFIFRIIIGLLFIFEYFYGFDGHGRGAGNIMSLGFGIAFTGYGLFGFIQRASLRKKRTALLKKVVPTDAVDMGRDNDLL